MSAPAADPAPLAAGLSPRARAWRRFRANRRGWWSLWIFGVLFGLSLGAELLSNDRPLLVHYAGAYYYPLLKAYPASDLASAQRAATDLRKCLVRVGQRLRHDGARPQAGEQQAGEEDDARHGHGSVAGSGRYRPRAGRSPEIFMRRG